MRFAICDDEPTWVKRIRNDINRYFETLQIICICDSFTSGEALLAACRDTFYDAVFLDVEMPGQNGIDLAAQIRQISPHSLFLFISSYLEFATSGYRVNAIGYILKQEMETFLPERLEALLSQLQPKDNTLELLIEGSNTKVNLWEVLYFAAKEHYVVIHFKNSHKPKCLASISLLALEQMLIEKPFLRIHKSYLVNMHCVLGIKNYNAMLENGVVLRVSQTQFSEIRNQYLLWKGSSL